jgi:hypothetical protein
MTKETSTALIFTAYIVPVNLIDNVPSTRNHN